MSLTLPPRDLSSSLNLSVDAASLTTSYADNATAAIAARGTAGIEARCSATFKAATTLTSISFQWQVSDDNAVWDPVAGVDLSDGTVVEELTIAASAGNTVTANFSTPNHKRKAYVRLATKHTGGAPAGADASAASLGILP